MQCKCGNPEMKFIYSQPAQFSCFWCSQCGRLGRETTTTLKFGFSVQNKDTYEEHELLNTKSSSKKRLPPDVVEAVETSSSKISYSMKTRTRELVRQLKSHLKKKKDDSEEEEKYNF